MCVSMHAFIHHKPYQETPLHTHTPAPPAAACGEPPRSPRLRSSPPPPSECACCGPSVESTNGQGTHRCTTKKAEWPPTPLTITHRSTILSPITQPPKTSTNTLTAPADPHSPPTAAVLFPFPAPPSASCVILDVCVSPCVCDAGRQVLLYVCVCVTGGARCTDLKHLPTLASSPWPAQSL